MTRQRSISVWLDGRLASYQTLGTLTTASASCEVSPTQMIIAVALLDARCSFVSRSAIVGVLAAHYGWPREDAQTVSTHVSLMRRRFDDTSMPLTIHTSHGHGWALTWAGEMPIGGGTIRRECVRLPKDERAVRKVVRPIPEQEREALREALTIPTPALAARGEILRLRNQGGKDKGWSVKAIAKHLGLPESDVAAVLGVVWGVT